MATFNSLNLGFKNKKGSSALSPINNNSKTPGVDSLINNISNISNNSSLLTTQFITVVKSPINTKSNLTEFLKNKNSSLNNLHSSNKAIKGPQNKSSSSKKLNIEEKGTDYLTSAFNTANNVNNINNMKSPIFCNTTFNKDAEINMEMSSIQTILLASLKQYDDELEELIELENYFKNAKFEENEKITPNQCTTNFANDSFNSFNIKSYPFSDGEDRSMSPQIGKLNYNNFHNQNSKKLPTVIGSP